MLNIQELKRRLKTKVIGRQIYYYQEIDSTNVMAHRLAQEGSPEGSLLIAEYQTHGKGRLGRRWSAKKFDNILLSIILKPDIPANKIHLLTLHAATMIIESIRAFLSSEGLPKIDLRVKWPNDVTINGKKIAGILCESKIKGEKVDYVIAGIGINLNQNFYNDSLELRKSATSLMMESAHFIDRDLFLEIFLHYMDEHYLRAASEKFGSVIDNWKQYWDGQYTKINMITNGAPIRVTVENILPDGKLLLKRDNGASVAVTSGARLRWN